MKIFNKNYFNLTKVHLFVVSSTKLKLICCLFFTYFSHLTHDITLNLFNLI